MNTPFYRTICIALLSTISLISCMSTRYLTTPPLQTLEQPQGKLALAGVEVTAIAAVYPKYNSTHTLYFNNASFLLRYFSGAAPATFLNKLHLSVLPPDTEEDYKKALDKSNIQTPYVGLKRLPVIYDSLPGQNATKEQIVISSNRIDQLGMAYLNQYLPSDYYLAISGGVTRFIPGLLLLENQFKTEIALVIFSSNGEKVFAKAYPHSQITRGEPSESDILGVMHNTFKQNQTQMANDLEVISSKFILVGPTVSSASNQTGVGR